MEEPTQILEPGTAIITHNPLSLALGILVEEEFLNKRKPGQKGVIVKYVDGHGGDIYYVKHDNSDDISVYGWYEMELISVLSIHFSIASLLFQVQISDEPYHRY